LYQAFAQLNVADFLSLRVGKDWIPISYEQRGSTAALETVFGGYTAKLLPTITWQARLTGSAWKGALEYDLGLALPSLDGQIEYQAFANSSDFDGYGRIFARPFKNTEIDALKGLGLGIGGYRGRRNGAAPTGANAYTLQLVNYSSYGAQAAFSWGPGVFAQGPVTKIAPQADYAVGPLAIEGDYLYSDQTVFLNQRYSAKIEAWNIVANVIFTGENAIPWGLYSPNHPVNEGGVGTIGFAARYSAYTVHQDVFYNHLAAIGAASADGLFHNASARRADTLVLGVNWYPIKGAKLAVDYGYTTYKTYDAWVALPVEHVINTTFQFFI
jgi:hypothetical protein